MKRSLLSLLPLLSAAVALAAQATVYKCAGDKGGVIYQDLACAPGKELRNLDADPATVSVVPLTPAAAAKAPPASVAKPAQVQIGTATARGSAAERKFLKSGMSEAEVIQKVGRPDVESDGHAKAGRRWLYLPTAGDPNTLTTLRFNGGTVTDVERKVVR
jgi:Domain of unknown function (DUF4124)